MKNGRVYIDHETCIKIIMKAAENNGRVILEAKGFPMFEISMNVDLAKKEWVKIERMLDKHSRHQIDHMDIVEPIIFDTRSEAEDALNALRDVCKTYGVVSVADYYDIIDVPSDYMVSKYGWINLDDVKVTKTQAGYTLQLPRAMPIE